MAIKEIGRATLRKLIGSVGLAGAHYLFPTDLDTYYACSLELVDSEGDTVDYFVFPIMPNDYSSTYTSLTNVKKAAGGILVIKNPGFKPKKIRISGDFGRNFRFMIGQHQVSSKAWKYSTAGGDYNASLLPDRNQPFIIGVKTGYGAIKVLEAVIFKASQLDIKGRPFTLYFYNPALGESYIVSADSLSLNQNLQKNQIWSYQLQMTAIGFTGSRRMLWKIMSASIVSRGIDSTVNKVIKQLVAL